MKTAVLLATYNGEAFLREQLESLYAQTFKDWVLYVHDDGSTDNTMAILREYELLKDNFVMLDYPSQHGAKDNFLSMIMAVEADYYFLCDQDDFWCPEKMEKEMGLMKQMEVHMSDVPLLVVCDACVADSNLNVTSTSLWYSSGRIPELLDTFERCGALDFATGCTMLFNGRAKSSIVFPARCATMHDAWITLCILKAQGKVGFIHESLLYYRQHGNNTLGAGEWTKNKWKYSFLEIRRVLEKNRDRWKMLKALGYGSWLKYVLYKMNYKIQRARACRK